MIKNYPPYLFIPAYKSSYVIIYKRSYGHATTQNLYIIFIGSRI